MVLYPQTIQKGIHKMLKEKYQVYVKVGNSYQYIIVEAGSSHEATYLAKAQFGEERVIGMASRTGK